MEKSRSPAGDRTYLRQWRRTRLAEEEEGDERASLLLAEVMMAEKAAEAKGGEERRQRHRHEPDVRVGALLVAFARAHPGLTALAVLSLLIVPLQEVLVPHLTGRMLERVRAGGEGALRPLLVLLAVVAAVQAAQAGSDLIDTWLYPSLQNWFRDRMLRAMLAAHDGDLASELRTGALASQFVRTPMTIGFFLSATKSLAPHLFVFLGAAAYFGWLDPPLGAAVLGALGAVLLGLRANLRGCAPVSTARDLAVAGVTEGVDELLRNLPAVYGAGARAREAEVARFRVAEDEARALGFRSGACALRLRALAVPAALAMIAFVLLRGRVLVRARRLPVALYVSMTLIALYMLSSLMRIGSAADNLVYHMGVLRAMDPALWAALSVAGPPEVGPSSGGAEAEAHPLSGKHEASAVEAAEARGVPLLSARDLWYVPPANGGGRRTTEDEDEDDKAERRPALSGASLEVAPGERVVLSGAIGSGKSTLLRALARVLTPQAGELRLAGVPYARLPPEAVRAQLAYVPQAAPLFDRTVLENACYGMPVEGCDDVALRAAARELGLEGALDAMGGPGAAAGKAGSRLSGGQRQVVWLLRATLRRPRPAALLLDEPTAALDPRSRDLLVAALARVPRDVALVVVSHDPTLAAALDARQVTMAGGRVVDDGV